MKTVRKSGQEDEKRVTRKKGGHPEFRSAQHRYIYILVYIYVNVRDVDLRRFDYVRHVIYGAAVLVAVTET